MRFAFGTLDDAVVAALLTAAPSGARAPLDDPPMAEVRAVDVGRIGDRARRDHALLIDALGDRRGGGAEADRAALVRDHVWVQALDDEGVLVETTVLEERFDAADAAGSELWFYLQPDREGVGGTVANLLDGASWMPLLMVDGKVRRGASFDVGGSSGGLLGGLFGSAGPELVVVRLELESHGLGP
ncbi:MAG: hypothetical protein P1P87_05475, partial [Trueperaceae bacterium]|nr:hypothetical protein [Trueperaceae bacterium]